VESRVSFWISTIVAYMTTACDCNELIADVDPLWCWKDESDQVSTFQPFLVNFDEESFTRDVATLVGVDFSSSGGVSLIHPVHKVLCTAYIQFQQRKAV
jgi:hypothetical protein